MANVALKKPIEEPVSNSSSATDGNASKYTATSGFAEFSWPYMITVDLGTLFRLSCIRLLLWDGLGESNRQRDTRIYKYRLLTSTDHKTWKVIYDSLQGGGNGWQEFRFPIRLGAQYVRVHGVSNSANDKFQIVQVEAYDDQPPALDAELVLAQTVLTESVEMEVGDGLPLQVTVQSIIKRIENLMETHKDVLNVEAFRPLTSQLRNQASDVASLERGMESIRRQIITPVRRELQQSAIQSARLGRFSKGGFWVGLVGGLLAIVSLTLPLVQGWRHSALQANSAPQGSPESAGSETDKQPNPPKSFYFRSASNPNETHHVVRAGDDLWFEEYPDGTKLEFRLSGRTLANGCYGSLLRRINFTDLEVFVPDYGCRTMEYLFRTKKGSWTLVGEMDRIQ